MINYGFAKCRTPKVIGDFYYLIRCEIQHLDGYLYIYMKQLLYE